MDAGRVVRLTLAALGMLLLGMTSVASAAPRAAVTIDVTIENFSYSPKTITIERGDTVRWTNVDPVFHSAISIYPGFMINPIGPTQSTSVTFDRPGTYDYVCGIHGQQMRAMIIVAGIAEPTEAPTADPNAHVVQDSFIHARPDFPNGLPSDGGRGPLLYGALAVAGIVIARGLWAFLRG